MVRSAPPEKASLPEAMTQPLMAASATTRVDDRRDLVHHLGGDDVHRAAGHVPGGEREPSASMSEGRSWIEGLTVMRIQTLSDDRRRAHAGGDAERDEGGRLARPLQFVERGAQDHRAGGAKRMAHGDGAAAGIDALRIEIEGLHVAQHHRGERLVDLEQVDVGLGHARALQDLLGDVDRARSASARCRSRSRRRRGSARGASGRAARPPPWSRSARRRRRRRCRRNCRHGGHARPARPRDGTGSRPRRSRPSRPSGRRRG